MSTPSSEFLLKINKHMSVEIFHPILDVFEFPNSNARELRSHWDLTSWSPSLKWGCGLSLTLVKNGGWPSRVVTEKSRSPQSEEFTACALEFPSELLYLLPLTTLNSVVPWFLTCKKWIINKIEVQRVVERRNEWIHVQAFLWRLSQQMTAVSRTDTVLETQCRGGGGQEEEKEGDRGDREQSTWSKETQIQSQVSSSPVDHSLSKPQLKMPDGPQPF